MELCLVVDHACNLRCTYCYTGKKFHRPMNDAIMRQAVQLALDSGDDWLSVSLFGGEPLLEKGILERVERIVEDELSRRTTRPQLRYLIDTNGTRFDEQTLNWLAHHDNCVVVVSVDGLPTVHDRLRLDVLGRGSSSQVLRGLHNLRERKIAFQLVAVVNPETVHALGTSLEFLIAEGPRQVSLQTNLRAPWGEPDIERLKRGAAAAAQVWAESFVRGRPLKVEPFHSKVVSHVSSLRVTAAGCRSPTRELTVAPSGRLYTCAEMVGEDDDTSPSIGDVFAGIDHHAHARLKQAASREHPLCSGCELKHRCSHGCACKQRAVSGTIGGLNALMCETEAAFIDAADLQAKRLLADGCESFIEAYYPKGFSLDPPPGGRPLTHLRVLS